MIELTQRMGNIRVVENDDAVHVGFYKRELSPALSPVEARALAQMLNAAARRVEGKHRTDAERIKTFHENMMNAIHRGQGIQ